MINIDTQGVSVFSQTITTPKEAAHVTKQQVNLPENKPIINLNKAPIERTVQVGIVDGDKEYERRGGTIIFTDLTPYINNFDLSKMVGLPRSADELASSKVESFILIRDSLKGQEQKDFVNFAASLSKDNLIKSIDAVDTSGGGSEIPHIASGLREDLFGDYFDAVVMADGDKVLNDMMSKNVNIPSFLDAAIKTNNKIVSFLERAVDSYTSLPEGQASFCTDVYL